MPTNRAKCTMCGRLDSEANPVAMRKQINSGDIEVCMACYEKLSVEKGPIRL
jgi:hypothetical protein